MNRMNWPSMNRSQGDNELSIELHATNPVTSQAKTNLSGKNLEVLKKISSTFIVAEEDKQLITKMESDQLRTSVLQLNRPINPYYDSSSVRQLPKNPSTSSSLASSTTTPSPPYSSSSSPPSSINVSPKLPAEIGVLTKNNGGGRLNGGISRPRLSAINNKVGLQRRTETAAIFNEKPPSQQVRNTKLMAQAQQKKESSNKKPHQSEVLDTGLIEECARSTRQNIQLLEELEFEDFHRRGRQNLVHTDIERMVPPAKGICSPQMVDPFELVFGPDLQSSWKSSSQGSPPLSSSSQGSTISDHTNTKKALSKALAEFTLDDDVSRPKTRLLQRNKKPMNGIFEKDESPKPAEVLCRYCERPIVDSILRAFGQQYHPECFCCSICECCLDGVPFTMDDDRRTVCMPCYEQNFVSLCSGCHLPIKSIDGSGQVVRVIAGGKQYHAYSCCPQNILEGGGSCKCEGCGLQIGAEGRRCYPIDDHLLCRTCHNQWKKLGGLSKPISDL